MVCKSALTFLIFLQIVLKIEAGHDIIRGDFVMPEGTPTTTVRTKFGDIEGFAVDHADYSANVFVGIPYAAPPIGDLKLEKPQPVESWNGTLEAKKWPFPCAPHCAAMIKWIGEVSENCLHLNIFTPSTPPPDGSLYPVAVWIHGGGFCFGDTQSYGFEGFVKNFVSKGIIVVSVQYRLGPFGFFSTGDSVAPGNLGLWDQRQALLFLHDVLKDFGGDKNRITVFGHSAGGTSASLLSTSPHTRDLFAQVYQLSGSALVEWGNSPDVTRVSKELAQHLNCPATSCPITLKTCVKNKSTDEILQAADNMGLSVNGIKSLHYQPDMTTDWITSDYFSELENTKPKPTILGLTSAESYLSTVTINNSLATMFSIFHGYTKEQQPKFDKNDLINAIKEKIATVSGFGQFAADAANDLIEFYAENASAKDLENPTHYFSQYSQLFSDVHFVISIAEEALEKAKLGWPTFIYLFDWTNSQIANEHGFFDGSPHGLELAYILDAFIFGDFEFNEKDYEIKKILTEGITNFIKTGTPISDDKPWPAVSSTSTFNLPYLYLGNRTDRAENFFEAKLTFWKKFNEKYHFDVIRGLYKNFNKIHDEL